MGLPCQMIKLRWLNFGNNTTNRGRIVQIGVVQEQAMIVDFRITVKVLQSRPFDRAGTTDQPVNFVAFVQKKFGKIGSVLTGDAGDECGMSFQFSVFRERFFSRQRTLSREISATQVRTNGLTLRRDDARQCS